MNQVEDQQSQILLNNTNTCAIYNDKYISSNPIQYQNGLSSQLFEYSNLACDDSMILTNLQNNCLIPINSSNDLYNNMSNSALQSLAISYDNEELIYNNIQYEIGMNMCNFQTSSANIETTQNCSTSQNDYTSYESCASTNNFQAYDKTQVDSIFYKNGTYEQNSVILNNSLVIGETPSKSESSINSTPIKSIGTLNADIDLPYNAERLTYSKSSVQSTNRSSIYYEQGEVNVETNFNVENRVLMNNEPTKTVASTSNNYINGLPDNININKDVKATPEQNKKLQTPIYPKGCCKPIVTNTQVLNDLERTPENLDQTYGMNSQNLTFNEMSPEMFSDNEIDDSLTKDNSLTLEEVSPIQKSTSGVQNENKLDRKLLRRVKESLLGVLPPPSVTISKLNVSDMLERINNNKHLFICHRDIESYEEKSKKEQITVNNGMKSLLINSCKEAVSDTSWPLITKLRYHGLHYNRTKVSEEIEYFCQRYGQRYIGSETASSCTIWSLNAPSSASKRRYLQRSISQQSPGRRLSHLARRRIAFSKDNLYTKTNSSVLAPTVGSKRQILIDMRRIAEMKKKGKSPRKKSPRKYMSPRKKTPRKTPNTKSPRKKVKTPCSSSKKRASRQLLTEESTSTASSSSRLSVSKRALFQSPEIKINKQLSSAPIKNKTPETKKNLKSKRALFSSPTEDNCSKKRKRTCTEDEFSPQRSKFAKSFSTNDMLNNKSIEDNHLRHSIDEPVLNTRKNDLTDIHKKKLLWAVSEALRSQNIGMHHPQFKNFAATLARVVRKLMPDLVSGGPRAVGSTSERMARIARTHVFAVVKGKTGDEIIAEANVTLKNIANNKRIGYVPPSRSSSVLSNISQKSGSDISEIDVFGGDVNNKFVLESNENQYIDSNCTSTFDKLSSVNSSAAGTVKSVLRDKLVNVNCENTKNVSIHINRTDYDKIRIKRQIKFDASDGNAKPS